MITECYCCLMFDANNNDQIQWMNEWIGRGEKQKFGSRIWSETLSK